MPSLVHHRPSLGFLPVNGRWIGSVAWRARRSGSVDHSRLSNSTKFAVGWPPFQRWCPLRIRHRYCRQCSHAGRPTFRKFHRKFEYFLWAIKEIWRSSKARVRALSESEILFFSNFVELTHFIVCSKTFNDQVHWHRSRYIFSFDLDGRIGRQRQGYHNTRRLSMDWRLCKVRF